MTDKPKNPPAYPKTSPSGFPDDRGMTLRDYFAGQALAGILVNDGNREDGDGDLHAEELAYWYADAMLKEREK